jgi:hypothetical protein
MRNLFLFFALVFIGARGHGQELHFSDLQSLYSADSASFRNFCKTNGFDKETFRQLDKNYSISFYSSKSKIQLSRAFGNDPSDSIRTTYVLNYFYGDRKKLSKQFKKEVKKAGFRFERSQPIAFPNNYSVKKDVYTNGFYEAHLETHYKNRNFFGYELSYCRQFKKQLVKN